MKIEDFALIQYTKTGEKRILAYHIKDIVILEQYFKECYYKPSLLAKRLGMHYQSCRKILQDCNLWHYVSTKNGKGSGFNLSRRTPTSRNGYLYSEDLNSYKIIGNRSRRKLMHIDVMEKALGRDMKDGEVIHHIDGNKTNNELSNLLLTNKSEHKSLHVQLEKLSFEFLKQGLIIFDSKERIYKIKK